MTENSGLCRSRDSLLLLIDMQERLAQAVPAEDFNPAANSAEILLQTAVHLEIPVLTTEQYPQGLGTTVARLSSHLPAGTRPMNKTGFSCCAADGFENQLAVLRRKQVILAGMETHVCILQTALELQQRGYQVYVAEDACCARSPQRTRNGIERMRQAGITVTHSESVMFEWLRDASHPQFKTVSMLLK